MLKKFLLPLWHADPRFYQITILTGLLIYGIRWLNFEVSPQQIFIIITTALLTQWFCSKIVKLLQFDWKSALISSLSLCILLRTSSLFLMSLVAFITILSKFTLRWRDKHIFNPTNFGLVTILLLTDQAWVSPGQWGSAAFFGFLLACLGMVVVNRAERSDITLAFLLCYTSILFGRALWLGDPITIPLHQLENGALLLFSFFMISDPKTTPNSPYGRFVFALLVALSASFVQFVLFRTNGLLWSLAIFSCLIPLIDWLLPHERYQWQADRK
jgi:Na+-transporting NADH:ubiquinone oxidoreductase subunit NqrB